MLINFVFPSYACPEKGQTVDIRANVDWFDRSTGRYTEKTSLRNSSCGEVTDIQPHADPDFRVVTVSVTSEL